MNPPVSSQARRLQPTTHLSRSREATLQDNLQSKKRILHLITGLEVGGAEMMLAKILPETVDQFDHHVCSIVGVGPVGDLLAAAGVTVHHLDLNNRFDISVVPKFKRFADQLKPDVLITYLPHADLLGRIIGTSSHIPTIVSSIRVKLPQSKYLPFFILDGLTAGLVTHYHFNSAAVAELHKRYLRIPHRKITTIPNAIDSTKYHVLIDSAAKKQQLGLPEDELIIGCVARLRRQKGHPYLIQAFREIVQQRPKTRLVLVGDGEEKNNLRQLITNLGLTAHVSFLGNRHDIPEILQLIDVFALTTLYEGMSNSIMEAMSARLPILTTDIPENRELLRDHITALLVPRRNPTATAAALIKLIDQPDLRTTLATAAHREITQHYQISHIANRYREFYASL